MQRIFSNPPEENRERVPEPSAPPPVIPPRGSVYVREVTREHESAIARILARVRTHDAASPQAQEPPEE